MEGRPPDLFPDLETIRGLESLMNIEYTFRARTPHTLLFSTIRIINFSPPDIFSQNSLTFFPFILRIVTQLIYITVYTYIYKVVPAPLPME